MNKLRNLAIAFLSLVVLLVNIWWFYPFSSDDTFISLRYAQRLLEGHGLTWNEGEWVEGYTNLLWILLTSFLGLFHVDLTLAVRLLGIASILATLFAIQYSTVSTLSKIVSSLALAVTGTVGAWAIGGLEEPLFGALFAWSVVLLYPLVLRQPASAWNFFLPGLLMALLAMTRPDGVLLTFTLALVLVLTRGFDRLWIFVTPPILFAIGQLLFRVYYYDSFLPNTAYVKMPLSFDKIHSGLGYIVRGFIAYPILFTATAYCLWKLWRTPEKKALALLFFIPTLFWVAYLVYIGGDIFLAYRHLLIVLILACLCLAQGLELFPPSKKLIWLCIVGLLLHTAIQLVARDNRKARVERREWDASSLGLILRNCLGDHHPLLATDPAGIVPYYSELQTVDMLGLNDKHIARVPSTLYAWIGHDHGDGPYVYSRHPDLILMQNPWGADHPTFKSSSELVAMPEFHQQYRLIHLAVTTPDPAVARLWVRWKEGPLAIEKSPGRIIIPGYLFALDREHVAVCGPEHKLEVDLSPDHPLTLDQLDIPAGKWSVEAKDGMTWDLWPSSPKDHSFKPQTSVQVDGEQMYTLELRSSEPTKISQVSLQQANPAKEVEENKRIR